MKDNLFVKFLHQFRKFGLFIASVVNFILLLIVYILGIGLTSIIGKLFRAEFLDLKEKKPQWADKKEFDKKLEDFYRSF